MTGRLEDIVTLDFGAQFEEPMVALHRGAVGAVAA